MPVIKVNTDIVMVDRGHKEDKENIHSDKEEDMDEEQLKDDSSNVMDTNNEDYIDDEPVSPPPCSPEEAPKLLMSQTIEVKVRLFFQSWNQININNVGKIIGLWIMQQ